MGDTEAGGEMGIEHTKWGADSRQLRGWGCLSGMHMGTLVTSLYAETWVIVVDVAGRGWQLPMETTTLPQAPTQYGCCALGPH